MSQVTAPTSGQIKLRGRVASLLEVGTGFHLALTGRENIFLNGAILGMSKAEIRRKFDEIVAFSECEAFIDTPVRRYSSGMYLRLAFAVAAHLESEILIVDEVSGRGGRWPDGPLCQPQPACSQKALFARPRLNCSRWWASVPRHLPPQGRGEINECVTCHVREAPGSARAC